MKWSSEVSGERARRSVCMCVWVQKSFFDDSEWCLLPVATTCNIWRHVAQNMNLMNFVFQLYGRVSSERRGHESQRRADDYYQKRSYQNLIKWMRERAPRKHAYTYLFWIKCNAEYGIDSHTQLRAHTKKKRKVRRVFVPRKVGAKNVLNLIFLVAFCAIYLAYQGYMDSQQGQSHKAK